MSGVCIIGGSSHKYFCCDKSFIIRNTCLSQQTCVCCNKTLFFIVTQICLSQQNFCHDKIMSVAANICHDKGFVATSMTKVLSRQAYFCHDKRHVLSQQNFVVTKMILVAAPVSDKCVSLCCKRVQRHWMSQLKRLGS